MCALADVDDRLPLVDRGRAVYADRAAAPFTRSPGQGSPRFPLDGVGARLSTREIRLWIVAPQEIRPEVRKPAYDHLDEADVMALIAYMESV